MIVNAGLYILSLTVYIQIQQGTCVGTGLGPVTGANAFPGGPNAELYRNRKGYFSINIQAVTDSDLKFTNIVARWPGSVHDSRIFNSSRLCGQLENGDIQGYIYEDRRRRSSKIKISAALVSSVVRNARVLFSGRQDKVYVKSGGFKQAKKDFYALQPMSVKNTYAKGFQADKRGYLNGLSVYLNKNPETNSAILTVVKTMGSPKRTTQMKTILYTAD